MPRMSYLNTSCIRVDGDIAPFSNKIGEIGTGAGQYTWGGRLHDGRPMARAK